MDYHGALCEIIENAMEATVSNEGSREVTVSLDKEERTISITDNGYGMGYWEGKQYHRLGSTNHNMHQAAIPKRKAQPIHLTCKIGKYGIGKNAVFKFGRCVLVEVISKKKDSEFVHILRQNYAEMMKQDKLMHSHERRLPKDQEKDWGQFTMVKITGVDAAFFEDFSTSRDQYLKR